MMGLGAAPWNVASQGPEPAYGSPAWLTWQGLTLEQFMNQTVFPTGMAMTPTTGQTYYTPTTGIVYPGVTPAPTTNVTNTSSTQTNQTGGTASTNQPPMNDDYGFMDQVEDGFSTLTNPSDWSGVLQDGSLGQKIGLLAVPAIAAYMYFKSQQGVTGRRRM